MVVDPENDPEVGVLVGGAPAPRMRAFEVTRVDGTTETVMANAYDVTNVAGHVIFIDIDADGRSWHRRVINVHQWTDVRELPVPHQNQRQIN